MNRITLFFTSDTYHILPSGQKWWSGLLISVEAVNQDDAIEFVGALTNDNFSVWYNQPENIELIEAIVLPEGWQPCPAYLVCQQHLLSPTLVKRFRVKSRASITRLLAENYMRRMQDENQCIQYFMANQIGQRI